MACSIPRASHANHFIAPRSFEQIENHNIIWYIIGFSDINKRIIADHHICRLCHCGMKRNVSPVSSELCKRWRSSATIANCNTYSPLGSQ
jgi:hypothetical protein